MIKLVNEMAKLDVLVVFQTAGSGAFNCDARRLAGLQQKLPPLLLDPKIKFFKALQDHYGLCRFGTTDVKVSRPYLLYLEDFFFENSSIC